MRGVIYNGRSPQWFNPHGEKEDLVLTVGRLWDPAKQISLLTKCDCGWPSIIAGETQHPDQAYRAETKRIVCEGMLELKGKQTAEQLRSLFARASIYAATSRYEPFGLALVEAALSRCAIIANDIPPFRELWGETACYFQTDSVDDLRDVAVMLRSDRTLRRKHAELAYQRARRHFSADRMVEEYLQVLSNSQRKEVDGRMRDKLRFRIFAHSWLSDWNHGNAHFLRGLARELVRMGHEVRCYEEMGSWSLANLMSEGEIASRAIDQFRHRISRARRAFLSAR